MIFLIVTFLFSSLFAQYQIKVKDVLYVNGVKRNLFTGYGLVVGLANSGDNRSLLTNKSLQQFLVSSGMNVDEKILKTRNVAAVAVSATTYGFNEKGDFVDVQVASVGDAESINNGLLLTTALKGANNKTYIVAGGVVNTGSGETKSRGTISSGGVIERSFGNMSTLLAKREAIELMLKRPSFNTVATIKEVAEENLDTIEIEVLDDKRIKLKVKGKGTSEIAYETLSAFMNLDINIVPKPKVIIDKKTGVVVVGNNVRIESVFVALPHLLLKVEGEEVDTENKVNPLLPSNSTVRELADGLLKMGASSEEMISIFDALNKSGALNAEIVVQ